MKCLCVSIMNRAEGEVWLSASLIKGIYHLTEGGNGLHPYAGIGNDFLMEGNVMLFCKS